MIMIDEMEWDTEVGPTHILDKNYNFLPIHVGINITDEDELCTLIIADEDYYMIDHKKPYILLHEVDDDPSFDGLSKDVRDKIAKILQNEVDDEGSMNREHLHVFKIPED
jgi:hypothetical protein